MLATIPLKLIVEGTRLRQANPEQVAAIIASIRDVGLLNPITVYPRKVIADNVAVDGYGIVAGLHRFTACRELGMEEIDAKVVTLGELERQIAECDENLAGPKLSPSEKALFTRRRQEAYEAIHGKATINSAKAAASARWSGDDAERQVGAPQTFAQDTASKTGQDIRSIQRNAERGANIDEQVLTDIKGTHLDSGAYMDSIKNLTKFEQRAKVTKDLDLHARQQEQARKQERDADQAKEGAEWIADVIGRNNIIALLAILESVPVKKLCAELKRV